MNQFGSLVGAVLYAALDAPASGELSHHPFLSRHFPPILDLRNQRLHQPPSRLNFEQFDAPLIVAFLDDLEKHRGITVRSRNLRLTANSTRRSNCQRRDIVVDQIIPRDSMAH